MRRATARSARAPSGRSSSSRPIPAPISATIPRWASISTRFTSAATCSAALVPSSAPTATWCGNRRCWAPARSSSLCSPTWRRGRALGQNRRAALTISMRPLPRATSSAPTTQPSAPSCSAGSAIRAPRRRPPGSPVSGRRHPPAVTLQSLDPALLRWLGPLRSLCFRGCFYKFSRRYMRMSSELGFLHWRFFRAPWIFLILFQIHMGGNIE